MSIPKALIEKYAEERSKRLRPENAGKFVNFRDPELAQMDRDLYVDQEAQASRDQPLEDGNDIQVLIVGAGIHGLIMAHRLVTEAGLKSEDMVLVDKAGGFGGTWYWNRYPGVMCDVEGYCYLPLLEETGYMPKQRYPAGYEIREQCERVARRWNLRGQFCTTVTHQQWDEESRRWIVTMTRDHGGPKRSPEPLTVRAQFLITAGGVFPTPQIPRLNGIDVFRSVPGKHVMHTARWDWTYSGGSQAEPDMVNFHGKRVGIIGTGATAVQVLPHVAKWAKHTYVFQRTPAYVGPHSQKKTTQEDWARVAYKKGWQYERMANLDASMTKEPNTVDLVQDGWSKVAALVALVGGGNKSIEPGEEEAHERAMLELDLPWTEQMRQRIDDELEDPITAANLKPWYPGFCKRPTFHDGYLSVFNEPHVTLVDTDGAGVQSYTANGVIANGQEYELDVLVLATGYITSVVDPCPSMAVNASIVGRKQRTLRSKWDDADFGTLFGVATHGFPNLFFCSVAGSAVSANLTPAFDINARLVAYIMGQALQRATVPSHAVVEVSKDAEDEYTAKVAKAARWFAALPSCTPNTFLEAEGGAKSDEEEEMKRKRSYWGGGILSYQRMVDEWKNGGGFDCFTVES